MEGVTPPIFLITDFGVRDPYAGQMKAVIAAVAPTANTIDLTHAIEPFAIDEAVWVIEGVFKLLPEHAIVAAVVDPGVGTPRRQLVARRGHRYFVGPDNGLISPFLPADVRRPLEGPTEVRLAPPRESGVEVRALHEPRFMRPIVSNTFHGRDIFAPAAAHLALGTDFRDFGPPLSTAVALPHLMGRPGGAGVIEGYVLHVDHYGNLITSIRASQIFPRFVFEVGDTVVDKHIRTFADAPSGQPFCHVDSTGFMAVAVNKGNAAEALGLGRGAPVRMRAR